MQITYTFDDIPRTVEVDRLREEIEAVTGPMSAIRRRGGKLELVCETTIDELVVRRIIEAHQSPQDIAVKAHKVLDGSDKFTAAEIQKAVARLVLHR